MSFKPPHPPSRPTAQPAPATAPASADSGAGGPSPRPVGRGLRRPAVKLSAAVLGLWVAAGLVAGAAAILLSGWMTPHWAAASAAVLAVLVIGIVAALAVQRGLSTVKRRQRSAAEEAPAGASRAEFLATADREFARSRRYGTGAALLIVEVDRLKRAQDAGDGSAAPAVLSQLLRQTLPTLRTADVLTAYSATQMAVFLAHADATGALDVAERIRDRTEHLELPMLAATPQRPRSRVTVSVGVAHLRPAHLNLQSMLDDAQDAVAAARVAGGNCVRAAPVEAAPGASGGWQERRSRPKQGGSG